MDIELRRYSEGYYLAIISFWRHVKSIHSVNEGEEQEIENNGIRGFILDEL